MKNNFIKKALVLSVAILALACNEDENTGTSTLVATTPSLNVTLSFANGQTLVEEEIDYAFTVTLSQPQISDVRVYLNKESGTATAGDDFSMPDFVTISAGNTSASDVITLHADELVEDVETAVIKIGTGKEANVTTVGSQTITFNILNLVEGDLAIGMSWEANQLVTDNFGNEIDATDLADMRLLITDVPFTQILDQADGAGFETYTLTSDIPDGEYFVVADFYAASDIPTDIDITLTFDQTGVINGQTHVFASALKTTDACGGLFNILAKIVKAGESYTITEVGEKSVLDFSKYVGTWSGPASWSVFFGYTSEVVTSLDTDGGLLINGLAFQWFQGWWGEVIVTNTPVKVTTFDPCTGEFEIAEQPYLTSTFNGDPQPAYGLSATGTLTESGGVISMEIFPVFHQSGGSFSGPEFGGVPFVETLTLDN